jgi:hypothetical protein
MIIIVLKGLLQVIDSFGIPAHVEIGNSFQIKLTDLAVPIDNQEGQEDPKDDAGGISPDPFLIPHY